MTLKSYAMLDHNNTVKGVLTVDAEPREPCVELLNWASQVPAQPEPGLDLMAENGELVWRDRRTNAQRNTDRWKVLKEVREVQEYGTFVFRGEVYQCDLHSQTRIHNLVILALLKERKNESFESVFITQDNKTVILDRNSILEFGEALTKHVTDTHQKFQKQRQGL